jgi:hypothetical protein
VRLNFLRILFIVIGLLGLGMVAAGIVQIHNKESGPKVEAKVLSCTRTGGIHSVDQCTATWVSGGSLVGGDGHVVQGPIDDANSDDIGRTLAVRIRGGQAYTGSLRVPIILIVLGLGIAAVGVLIAIKAVPPAPRAGARA